jgi:N-terminal domain of (some) glycogen debranching enzymes
MQRDGFLQDGVEHWLFVEQTRLLSHYRLLIDGEPPLPVALSNVSQHGCLGYYLVAITKCWSSAARCT